MTETTATPLGLDFGNGFVKLCLAGKTSKIPAAYSMGKPQGALSTKGTLLKPKAFTVMVGDQEIWVGQDVLGAPLIRNIDASKYQKSHIRILFAAALANHVAKRKVDPESLGRLHIVASMPPGLYQDAEARAKAERAYKLAFNDNRKPWWVRSSLTDTFRISTQFGGLKAEATSYVEANRLKPGLTLITDIGYGTIDFVLVKNGDGEPVLVKSFNNGLVHGFQQINEINHNQAELALLRKKGDEGKLAPHFNDAKEKLGLILRHIGNANVSVVVIGGGVKLMSKSIKDSFRLLTSSIVFKDEYVNAVSNATLAVAK